MADLLLDEQTGDLVVDNNAIRVTKEGTESISQRLRIRLRFFFREWILDRSQGTKWFEVILKKGVDKFAADAEIRKRVLDTPEIKAIERWTSSLDSKTRAYEVRFDVRTTEGESITFGFQDLLN
jgi:hypothetical protein